MKGIVDRFENDRVIIELKDGLINFDRVLFPDEIKEGDIVEYKDNKFIIKKEETDDRSNEIENLFKSLIDN